VRSGAKPRPLLILVLFELRRTRVETIIIAAFRGGARRFGPPLNTPLSRSSEVNIAEL